MVLLISIFFPSKLHDASDIAECHRNGINSPVAILQLVYSTHPPTFLLCVGLSRSLKIAACFLFTLTRILGNETGWRGHLKTSDIKPNDVNPNTNQNIILAHMDFTYGKDRQQHTRDRSWSSLDLGGHVQNKKGLKRQQQLKDRHFKALTSTEGKVLDWAPKDTVLGGITNL